MANEVSIGVTIAAKKEPFILPTYGKQRFKFDMNGLGGGVPGMVTVGQVAMQVDLSELATPRWVYLQNIDGYQTVRWAFSSADLASSAQLSPGAPALFELQPGSELWMQVDPATEESGSTSNENQAKVQIIVLEN